jgi:hypothetical protein
LQDPTTEFLNVDLHLKCITNLEAVCEAFGRSVVVLHRGRLGRKHWVVLELARSPKIPTEAIRRFATLATRLRGRAKAAWAISAKELDIGIQGGVTPDPAEWVVEAKAVTEAARIGARLRVTVYSPRQLMNTDRERPDKRLQPTARSLRSGDAPRLRRKR